MSFLSDATAELKALIISTLASQGATTDNVYMSIAAARMNLVEKVKNGQVDLPIWVLDAASANPDPEWGVDNDSFRMPVTIVEIRKSAGTDVQDAIVANLTTLQQSIQSGDHTYFLAIEKAQIDVSPSASAVDAMLDATLNANAGMLIYEPGLLVGEFQGDL